MFGQILNSVRDVVGGLTGDLSGKGPSVNASSFTDQNREANKRLLEAQRQSGLQIGQQGLSGQTQASSQQQDLIKQMQLRASGQVPSVAQMQFQQGSDLARQALASQAASQRGASAGLSQRNLARSQAGLSQDLVSQGAMLRAQEQQAAEQGLAGMLQGTRSQDQALMQQGQNLALQYMQLGMTADQAQFLANQKLEEMRLGASQVGAQQQAAMLGALGSVGASFLGG